MQDELPDYDSINTDELRISRHHLLLCARFYECGVMIVSKSSDVTI